MTLLWAGFVCMILAFLALDLGVINREDRAVGIPKALAWTTIWVSLSLLFSAFVYYQYEYDLFDVNRSNLGPTGREAVLQYLSAYLLEESLSLDNMFVIALILTYFRIPAIYQHRVLFWGILGAIVLRGAVIVAGITLMQRLEWMNYVFGAILLFTAFKLLFDQAETAQLDDSRLVRLCRKLMPVTMQLHGRRFIAREHGALALTPLGFVLILINFGDLIFAVDSIPAVFAVTGDSFIAFTSNIFAVLGLRSLYFVLAGVMDKFRYLRISLVILLLFIGTKMLISLYYKIPVTWSLAIIVGVLLTGIMASVIIVERKQQQPKLISKSQNALRSPR
ncbi:MAG TPA: TerC family protein [Gammaproteobacteria bacterium]|nr:TerC family protein [Gammaproteobacteria bacterium]